jgi:dTMP kinase
VFITLEGIEGSGKSTQSTLLKRFLEQQGYRVEITREPGGSPIGESIRGILLDPANTGMVPMAELLLYEASRTQHVEEVIRPWLESGTCVICDRFFDASTAYQGYGRGIPVKTVMQLNSVATSGLTPDLTIVLDLDAEKGLRRLGRDLDRIEAETLAFHRRVRQGYLDLARAHPGRIKVVEASGQVDEIAGRVIEIVRNNISPEKAR